MNKSKIETIKTFFISILFILLISLTLFNIFYDKINLFLVNPMNFNFDNYSKFVDTNNKAIPEPARPIAFMINKDGIISGAKYDDLTVNLLYNRFKTIIGEAIASASQKQVLPSNEWINILNGDCFYFEYLDKIPVWLLAEGLAYKHSTATDSLEIKKLVVSSDKYNKLSLIIHTGTEIYIFKTPLPFELPELDNFPITTVELTTKSEISVFPESTLIFEPVHLPVLSLQYNYFDEESISQLLTAFNFNPNTNFRYMQSDGDLVIVDDRRTIRISSAGAVIYHDSTQELDSSLDTNEAIRRSLNFIPKGENFWGLGRLEFKDASVQNDSIQVTYKYVWNGLEFLDSNSFFVFKNGVLSEAMLMLYPVKETDIKHTLLPMRQAAILSTNINDLKIAYAIGENGLYYPKWYN